MKILFVINSLVGGGAERVLVDMVKNMEGHEVTVLSIDDWGVYRQDIKKAVTYTSIIRHKSRPKLVRWFYGGLSVLWAILIKLLPGWVLYRWFVKEKYDVEVAFLEGMSTKVVAGSRNKNAVKYAWVHTDMEKNHWTTGHYRNFKEEKKSYLCFDRVMAVSKEISQVTDRVFHVKSFVQYNILDDIAIKKMAEGKKRSLHKRAKYALVSVGGFWKVKGYSRLVKIVHRLIRMGYEIELHLIGQGEEKEKIQGYIEENHLNERVILHGFVERPYDLLKQSDLYVCPSYVEGYSTSVTEALILGVPVITTDCPGMDELLGDSEYGMIVENKSEQLLDGIKQLLDHPQLLEKYKVQAELRSRDFDVKQRIMEFQDTMKSDVYKKRNL